MKYILVLFALIAVASCSIWKGGFRIRFGVGINFGDSFFFDIPRTTDDAVSDGWTTQEQPSGLPVTSVTMYCYEDLIVCTFYDDNGDVAGLQLALPVDDFTPHFDMEINGFTNWTAGPLRILATRRKRNENKITENGGLWLVGVNREVLQIANNTDALVESGLFTKQSCIPWMGRHYFYNMTTELSCTEKPLYPWFALVESGELIATGFMVFGTLNTTSSKFSRSWYEHPSTLQVEVIAPNGPDCMYDLQDSPGGITMHIYYVDQPWLVSCIFQ